jgi:hypothetical protein
MDAKTLENLRSKSDAKLRYAEIHLDELKSLNSINGSDFERAHQESFLFHLLGAKDAFLGELNAYYGSSLGEKDLTIGKLCSELKKEGKKSQELVELYNIEKDENGWYFHAKKMRDHSMHVSSVSRHYHLGGKADKEVWLSNPETGQIIERHFIEEFSDWNINMKILLERLRKSAINCNNIIAKD